MACRSAKAAALLAALLLALAVVGRAGGNDTSYDYTYEYNYAEADGDLEQTYAEDAYGYYGDDDSAYYEYYGYYADDFDGEEGDYYDYYDEASPDEWQTNCEAAADGRVTLHNGTASCELKIAGADKSADQLQGGIDGVYAIAACHNGKPLYRRKGSAAGQERTLWYSNAFGDWDVSRGSEPSDTEVLLYGGEAEHADTPLFVPAWHLAAGVNSAAGAGMDDDDFLPINVTVACADGSKPEAPLEGLDDGPWGPVLTPQEMEDKYRLIYDKYGKRPEPNPAVNTGFVVALAAAGLGIVLAVPYCLLKARRGVARGGLAGSLAAMLQQSKKKSGGHTN